jgi:hypothetical protein
MVGIRLVRIDMEVIDMPARFSTKRVSYVNHRHGDHAKLRCYNKFKGMKICSTGNYSDVWATEFCNC